MSKQAVVGILAHVDAGKTTLAEAMLFNAGRIRKRGRVDDGDSHLDTNTIERERGITIFSSQAVLDHGDTHVMLVDAPGHVDFSAEAERTLRALDYAILVVGANDGVQGHTETLWRLLARYDIPTFIFINKIDLENPGRDVLLAQLGQRLSEGCLDANELLAGGAVQEDAAALDEAALEEFLEAGELSVATLSRMVAERKLFPCFAGSALKDQGVDELLDGICALMREQAWLPEFAARVYRVSRGDRGERLAWVKVTGGTLRAKQMISGHSSAEAWEQKVDQVRIYNGEKYELAQEVAAGGICAVTGLAHVRPGDALGTEPAGDAPVIAPVLTYTVLPGEHDVHAVFKALSELADEDPMLGVSWNTHLEQIHLQLMGAVQLEVVQRVLADRFGLSVAFEPGGILYSYIQTVRRWSSTRRRRSRAWGIPWFRAAASWLAGADVEVHLSEFAAPVLRSVLYRGRQGRTADSGAATVPRAAVMRTDERVIDRRIRARGLPCPCWASISATAFGMSHKGDGTKMSPQAIERDHNLGDDIPLRLVGIAGVSPIADLEALSALRSRAAARHLVP